MDMVADKAMAVSMKNLVGWPLLALAAVVISSYQPSSTEVAQAQTATATSTVPPIGFPSPTPQQHPSNSPSVAPTAPPSVQPTTVPAPAVRNPVSAAPPGMVYDPALNSYHYPPITSRRHP
jgi:hypothetical protein